MRDAMIPSRVHSVPNGSTIAGRKHHEREDEPEFTYEWVDPSVMLTAYREAFNAARSRHLHAVRDDG